MNTTNLITKLAYENIDDTYSKARYGSFEVFMNMKTGYINATKLCADGGKLLKNWSANKNSQELIIECLESHGLGSQPVTMSVSGGQNTTIRGTYAHPDLIPHIASWVSPKFAIKVSKIVNDFLIREREEEIRRLTGEKSELVKMLEESEKRRKEDHKESLKMLEDMKKQNEKTDQKLDDAHKKLDKADNDIEDLQCKVEIVSERLDIVIDEVVPPCPVVELREEIGIWKLNDKSSKFTHKVFCRQIKTAHIARSRLLKEFPNATLFREINPSPNSKNFLHNLKDMYGTPGKNQKLKIYHNSIIMNGSNDELNLMIDNVLDKAKNFGL
jgi:hypothetical protein